MSAAPRPVAIPPHFSYRCDRCGWFGSSDYRHPFTVGELGSWQYLCEPCATPEHDVDYNDPSEWR